MTGEQVPPQFVLLWFQELGLDLARQLVGVFETKPDSPGTSATRGQELFFAFALAMGFTDFVDADAGAIFDHDDLAAGNALCVGEHVDTFTG